MLLSSLTVAKTEVAASEGMVVAQHPLIAEAGAAVLEAGGNAVDAAVAAAFAAGVVEPFMSGLGGDGALLLHDPVAGRSAAVDFIGRAPAAADPDVYEVEGAGAVGSFGWPPVRDAVNRLGWRAPVVPGAVAGLSAALERYGTRSLAEVLQPAIALAQEGFAADWYLSLYIAAGMSDLLRFPDTARIFLPEGAPPRPALYGEDTPTRFRQPDLARSLRTLAAYGPRAFYDGVLSGALVRALEQHGGLISAEDLAGYRPVIHERALTTRYRDRFEVLGVPGPTGSATLYQMLHLLEHFDLPRAGHNTPEALHLTAEAIRLAYADRFAFLGDPEEGPKPFDGIIARSYAAERVRTILSARTPEPPEPGDPWAHQGMRGEGRASEGGGSPANQTTHLCVVDRERRMVSVTNTLSELFGSRVVIPGTGILLNDGMVRFDPRPGRPNSVAPRRRPLCYMTPAAMLEAGRPYLVLGAPGGRQIPGAVLQTLLNVCDHGLSVQAAVAAPRLHAEGAATYVDDRVSPEVRAALVARGHQIVPLTESYATSNFARVVAIQVDAEAGLLRGGVHLWQPAAAAGVDAPSG